MVVVAGERDRDRERLRPNKRAVWSASHARRRRADAGDADAAGDSESARRTSSNGDDDMVERTPRARCRASRRDATARAVALCFDARILALTSPKKAGERAGFFRELVIIMLRALGFAPATPTVEYVVSERPYEVLDSATARQRAEFLHRLERWAHDFLDRAARAWPDDPRIRRIRRRWSGRLNEVVGADDAAFSRGKRAIYVCAWNKATDRLESFENGTYILLHELAHVANPTVGHDPPFWRAFKALLEMAHALGAYRHDAHRPDETYCGHRIGRSPAQCAFDGTCDASVRARDPGAQPR